MSRIVSTPQTVASPEAGPRLLSEPFQDRLIRVSEVRKLAGIGRNTIHVWMSEGKFPLAVDLGGRRVAWLLSDINAWIASRQRVKSIRVKRGVKPWERTPPEPSAA